MKKFLCGFVEIMLVALMVCTLCACGKNKAKNNSELAGMKNIQSMVDYAEKLEKAGNTEAAARIWACIENASKEAGGADAQKMMEDSTAQKSLTPLKKPIRSLL